ncbi:MAG: hypothetical protein IT489_03130 [Gammaproteobacteria bacterium]|nr:hypothetical protein [Gammaproteobacteria bacterium]
MTLYTINGDPADIDESVFGAPPAESLALKYNDDVDDSRWITDIDELADLWHNDAPLAYTRDGARQLAERMNWKPWIEFAHLPGTH